MLEESQRETGRAWGLASCTTFHCFLSAFQECISWEILRGKSSESTTPFTNPRYSGNGDKFLTVVHDEHPPDIKLDVVHLLAGVK
ncbi:hypothetical protein HAX54_012011 [Datura stramonium]|uniref:Uncharacterized protein n=1 Tax=Datura stramonium TaxID=4076 RepID=A0ABS8TJ44_DATST|nr:hypothetical protein [Datura stramonium]